MRLGILMLALAVFSGGRSSPMANSSGAPPERQIRDTSTKSVLPPAVADSQHSDFDRGIKRQALRFDGDRSLDVAIAVDEIRTAYTRYTIRLQLPTGSEQSIAVSAPPGGLQPEVRDMTGDNVRNDLILTPKLLQWPLTVLVNDGHDHFILVVSPAPPESLASKEAEASKGDVQSTAALTSSGFKIGALSIGGRLFLPQPQQTIAWSIAEAVAKRLGHPSSSGRAPPTLATQI
jgi:hypothetical protein